MSKNKIPKWWYAGFKKGFFYGCYIFVRSWYITYANPMWTIRDKYWAWRRRRVDHGYNYSKKHNKH